MHDRNRHENHSGIKNLLFVYLFMALLTAALLGAAFVLSPEKLSLEIGKSAATLLEALPVVVIGILTAGIITAFLPKGFIHKWAGSSSGTAGILLAAGAGAFIPCEPALGLPVVLGIARSGASVSFIVTLLTSSKLFSFMRIPDYFTFLNLELAILFLSSTIAMPLLSGLLTNFLAKCFPSLICSSLLQYQPKL